MATFAKTTFNAAQYASARPTYPRQLYEFLFQYHGRIPSARWGTAVDLGCGTGQATVELTPFKRVIGVEPSARMIEQANENIKSQGLTNRVEFVKSAAEDLSFLESGSVDFITSAQAAHWFDWHKLWPEAARVLRKDGTLAAWGYSQFRLTNYKSATPLIKAYVQGTDPTESVGPYWEQPGRNIVDDHLLQIPDPTQLLPDKFTELTRIFFTGDHYPELPSPRPVIMRKRTTWAGLLSYFRTFSALHTFHEQHPEDLQRADGDIAVRFWRRLMQEVAKQEQKDSLDENDEIEIEWPLALILARRA